uniref:Uncharacterized protein n=1 Tax=Anguilla anguilla TaxID=7936 RepID=A0A0E9SBC0_ANGAN
MFFFTVLLRYSQVDQPALVKQTHSMEACVARFSALMKRCCKREKPENI